MSSSPPAAEGHGVLSAAQAVQLASRDTQRIWAFSLTETVVLRGIPADTRGLGGAGIALSIKMQARPTLLAEVRIHLPRRGMNLYLDEIMTPRFFYIKRSGSPSSSDRWTKVRVASLPGGVNISKNIQRLQNGDPVTALSSPKGLSKLLKAAKHVRVVQNQVTDGVPTTEYAGAVAFTAFASLVPAARRHSLGSPPATLRRSGMPFEIWIDGQHHLRKLILQLDLRAVSLVTTVRLMSINQPVHIVVPAASQVATAPGL